MYKEEEYIDYGAEVLLQILQQDYPPEPLARKASRAKHLLRYYPVGFL